MKRATKICLTALQYMALHFLLTACSGGSANNDTGAQPLPVGDPPELTILFPTKSALTDDSLVLASGTVVAQDTEVTAINVYNSQNTIVASGTVSAGRWQAEVPLVNGLNAFTVAAVGANGLEGQAQFEVEKALPATPRKMVLDEAGNSIFVLDSYRFDLSSGIPPEVIYGTNSIIGIDLTTGVRRIFSGAGVGSGPDLGTPEQLAFDSDLSRFFVYDRTSRNVFEVDRDSGQRSIHFNLQDTADLQDNFNVEYMSFDAVNRRLLILVNNQPGWQLWSVRAADLHAEVLAVDSQASFVGWQPYAPAPHSNSIYGFAGYNLPHLHVLDLSTGEQRAFSPDVLLLTGHDGTIDMENIQSVAYSEEDNALYVAGSRRFQIDRCSCLTTVIVRVDLATGRFEDVLALGEQVGTIEELVAGSQGVLYGVEAYLDRVTAFNTRTGEINVISDSNRGAVTSQAGSQELVFDPVRQKLIIGEESRFHRAMWSNVDLETGERSLLIRSDLENGMELNSFFGSDFDEQGRLIWTDPGTGKLHRMSIDEPVIDTSIDVPLSGSSLSSLFPSGACYDDDKGLAYAISFNHGILYAADLDTGNVDQFETDYTVRNLQTSQLICDEPNSRIIAVDSVNKLIVGLSTENGEHEVLSGGGIGQGEAFNNPDQIAVSQDRKWLYLTDYRANTVIRVDLESGDRSVIYSDDMGSGPLIPQVAAVAAFNEHTVLVTSRTDADYSRIFAVEINSGSRVVMSY